MRFGKNVGLLSCQKLEISLTTKSSHFGATYYLERNSETENYWSLMKSRQEIPSLLSTQVYIFQPFHKGFIVLKFDDTQVAILKTKTIKLITNKICYISLL